jgi:oligopeptide/dipeptide ABC transporter ATP-binding protein
MKAGPVCAVDGISYFINKGETLGIVGESGCGKSVMSFSMMRLLDPPGRVTQGEVIFEGVDLLELSEENMRRIRGKEKAMIFQEPMTALNPVLTIGRQITEQILAHEMVSVKESQTRAIELLKKVGIPSPEKRVDQYPHQLSGGMRQRAMIAMAISCSPDLLIADEPTTALDVTIQAQIVDLLLKLQAENHMAIQFITHDLGLISEVADRIIVMYAGKIVEEADVKTIFENPKHPYTLGLLESIPSLGKEGEKLKTIPGTVPSFLDLPTGCRFQNRCPHCVERCRIEEPELEKLKEGHEMACWNATSPQ